MASSFFAIETKADFERKFSKVRQRDGRRQLLRLEKRGAHLPVLHQGYGHEQVGVPGLGGEGPEVHGFECPRAEVDGIHHLLGILVDLLGSHLGPKKGMAQRDHAGIVPPYPVHRARAQPEHQPHQAVRFPDLLVPGPRVGGVHDAGSQREEPVPEPPAHYLLDDHGHALVEVQEPVIPAVDDGVGPVHAGKHGLHALEEGSQPRILVAKIGEKDGLVLAREGQAEAVLQVAGGAHDDRMFTDLPDEHPELLHDVRRERGLLEQPADALELLVDRFPVAVLVRVKAVEVVSVDEIREHAGADVPRFRDRDVFLELGVPLREDGQEDLLGNDHAGRLAAELARVGDVSDGVAQHRVDVPDGDVVLGDADERELAGDVVRKQGDADAFRLLARDVQLPLGDVAELAQGAPDRLRGGAVTGHHPAQLLALVPLADQVDPVLRLLGGYRVGKEKVDEGVGVLGPVGLAVLHAVRAHLLRRQGGEALPGS